jgi:CMP-N,N'-diacetyllegionaminic acid synthase
MHMHTVAVILVRAGSKGLPNKCILPLCGRPVLSYTLAHAQESRRIDAVAITTDSPEAAAIARTAGAMVIDRPPHLATDGASASATVRDALRQYEALTGLALDVLVLLGGNVPLREPGLIDRCVDLLLETGCDSVQTVVAVGKHHPDWMYRVDAGRMQPLRASRIVRRQELEPLHELSGAVVVTRRDLLLASENDPDPTAYLGTDRRAVIEGEESVDIDTLRDFYLAEAVLRMRSGAAPAVQASHTPLPAEKVCPRA